MKFTVVLVLALVVCSFALKPKKLTSTQQERISNIRKTNSWASILINLAQLHVQARGPIDELVQAIQDTITDLGFQREKKDAAFVKRTNEHNALVAQLEADIANAEQDIEELHGILEMLAQQKASLEEEIAQLTAANAATEQQVADATATRAAEHEAYLAKVAETEQAIAAVEECLKILNEFAGNEVSFAQIKKGKEVIVLAQKRIEKLRNAEAPFLKALVQVAMNQEFADNAAVQQVISKFNEIKNNLYDASSALAADEELSQQVFEKFVADSRESIQQNNATIEADQGLLVENAANTVENQNLLAQREQDKADFEQALEDENNAYEDAKERYEAWCVENDREIEVCGEALEVVATVDFADYISDRVTAEDGLVSSGMATAQAHGQGTEVFNFDYDQF